MKTRTRLFIMPLFWLCMCLLLALFVLVYPIYVIRPFRFQGASELSLALAVLRYRPLLVIALSLAAALTLSFCWIGQRCGKWQKVLGCVCACLVFAVAFASRVNIYELMFHPLDGPTFSRIPNSKLDGKEEVIAVRVNRVARAYPIRIMSYHHVVNDVVGGLPVVATY